MLHRCIPDRPLADPADRLVPLVCFGCLLGPLVHLPLPGKATSIPWPKEGGDDGGGQ